jgi:hypothetical protein
LELQDLWQQQVNVFQAQAVAAETIKKLLEYIGLIENAFDGILLPMRTPNTMMSSRCLYAIGQYTEKTSR